MAITEAHAGRRYPPSDPYQVSAAKIAEFATALGDDNPDIAASRRSLRPPLPLSSPRRRGASCSATRSWNCRWSELCTAISASRSSDVPRRRRGDRDSDHRQSAVRAGSELVSATVDMSGRDGEQICSSQATFYHAREALA